MKSFPLPQQFLFDNKSETVALSASQPEMIPKKTGIFSPGSTTTSAILLFFFLPVLICADSLTEIQLMAPQDSLTASNNALLPDSSATTGDTVQKATDPIAPNIENNELENIVLSTKNIRAFGWGEYEVGGRCLCCDNMLDGDCIIVHNTNRTEKKRIKQIVDGKTDADTSDESTFFGNLSERERADNVTTLMAEITLNKQREIYRVIVYTVADKNKKSNFIASCEVGYIDQFDRLQWAGKAKFGTDDDHITFEMKKPILAGNLLIKTFGGKTRITELAIFCKKNKE